MYKQLAFFIVLTLFVVPLVSSAQTEGSTATCPLPYCDFDPKSSPPPCRPCQTQTGFGFCKPYIPGALACESKGVTQGDGSQDMAGAGGAEQMMQMAQKLMEQLGKGGGGGGGSPSGGSPTQGEQPKPSTVNDILSGLYGEGTEQAQQALNTVTDLLESNASTTVEDVAQVLAVIASQPVTGTGTPVTSTPTGGALEAVGIATRSFIDRLFGGGTATTEETNPVTSVYNEVTTFIQDVFDIVSSAEAPSFFARLCTNRPWQSSVVSSIFSTQFFDTLCVRHNTPIGSTENTATQGALLSCTPRVEIGGEATIQWSCPGSTHSGAVGFSTNGAESGQVTITPKETLTYELQCNNGTRASCTIVVGAPRADIAVSPLSVNLGGRARLYWTSEGVASCTIRGAGMVETGTSGAATTPAIYDRTEFTIECVTSAGATTTDSVTVDVGL